MCVCAPRRRYLQEPWYSILTEWEEMEVEEAEEEEAVEEPAPAPAVKEEEAAPPPPPPPLSSFARVLLFLRPFSPVHKSNCRALLATAES